METAIETQALVRSTMTIDEIKAHVGIIHNVMQNVMKNGTHYGKIPGCGDKPTLLKPGAEKIMMTFQLTPLVSIEDLSTADESRFRVKVTLTARDTTVLGEGVGECSSNEDKYKWRASVCNDEWDDTTDDKRRVKWDKYGNQKKQVRTNVADVANTVLKMAKKRAQVDACLTTTAASDIFVQDIEDIPEELLNNDKEAPPKPQPAPVPPSQPPPAPPKQEVPVDKDLVLRKKLGDMLVTLYLTKEKASAELEKLTAFEGDRGPVKGCTSCADPRLKGKWLFRVFKEVEKMYDSAGFNEQMPPDNEPYTGQFD